jgi:hypothetical protein
MNMVFALLVIQLTNVKLALITKFVIVVQRQVLKVHIGVFKLVIVNVYNVIQIAQKHQDAKLEVLEIVIQVVKVIIILINQLGNVLKMMLVLLQIV